MSLIMDALNKIKREKHNKRGNSGFSATDVPVREIQTSAFEQMQILEASPSVYAAAFAAHGHDEMSGRYPIQKPLVQIIWNELLQFLKKNLTPQKERIAAFGLIAGLVLLVFWVSVYALLNSFSGDSFLKKNHVFLQGPEQNLKTSRTSSELLVSTLSELTYRGDKSVLEGVMLDGKNPLCVIDGRVYATGQYWKGIQIVKIAEDGVLMKKRNGTLYRLKVN